MSPRPLAGGRTRYDDPTITGVLYDDFERADGPLGTAPTGQLWLPTGQTLPTIVDNTMLATINGYAQITVGDQNRMFGHVSWSGSDGGSYLDDLAAVTFIASYLDHTISDCVHVYCMRHKITIQVRVNEGPFIGLAAYAHHLLDDGTIYPFGMRIAGDVLTIERPDGSEVNYADSRLGDMWGSGHFLTYQTNQSAAGTPPYPVAGDSQPRWHDAGAELWTPQPPRTRFDAVSGPTW